MRELPFDRVKERFPLPRARITPHTTTLKSHPSVQSTAQRHEGFSQVWGRSRRVALGEPRRGRSQRGWRWCRRGLQSGGCGAGALRVPRGQRRRPWRASLPGRSGRGLFMSFSCPSPCTSVLLGRSSPPLVTAEAAFTHTAHTVTPVKPFSDVTQHL